MPPRQMPLPGQIGRGPAPKIVAKRRSRGAGGRSAKPLENINFWKNGRSGRIRTCDPCVPNVSSNRKIQQKQSISFLIDHLYRRLFTAFRWSIGGQTPARFDG